MAQMEVREYLEKMKVIQNNLLKYIESEQNSNENHQNLIKLLDDQKIRDNQHVFKSFLNLISRLSNHHHRSTDLFNKIEQILLPYKDDIKKYFSNYEIFNIFKENKLSLLLLIQMQLINIDENIANTIKSNRYFKENYSLYFFPEIKQFFNDEINEESEDKDQFKLQLQEFSKNLPENFEEKRKIGQNDSAICKLIRNDSLQEFLDHVRQNNLTIDGTTIVEKSIFETNAFLVKNKNVSLIEYAAFFGSIQIFNHILSNNIELNKSIWISAIHSNKIELINLLEEKNKLENDSYTKILRETIKCHHNKIKDHIQQTFFKDQDNSSIVSQQSLKYYNFAYVQNDLVNKSVFYDLCCNDYFIPVENIVKSDDIDVNQIVIQK